MEKISFYRKPAAIIFTLVLIISLMTIKPGESSLKQADAQVSLPTVESYEKLVTLLQEYREKQEASYPIITNDFIELSGPTAGQSAKISENSAQLAPMEMKNDFSSTNTQVSGVDEADLVKTDGKYIYQVKQQSILIVDAQQDGKLSLSSKIDFADSALRPDEIYIDVNYLVIIGNSYELRPQMDNIAITEGKMIAPPYRYRNQEFSKMLIYSIKDKKQPTKVRELELSGTTLSTRKIGSIVYLVTRQSIPFYPLEGEPVPLPNYLDSSKGSSRQDISYGDLYYFPGYIYPNYMTIASIDISENKAPIIKSYLGNAENMYMSLDSLYLAFSSTQFTYPQQAAEAKTVVHRFSLKEGLQTYIGSADVPGTILNQFSMDEYNNQFRIATTSGEIWSNDPMNIAVNNIYILENAKLNLLGKIEGIAPGEKIYSTRFMGERVYMVTFRKVDPFFVIDLKDPQNPKVLGKLKIPGYSDYLHPYDENHIIGFGKDTALEKGYDGNDMAYYQGFKMALFDVSDVNNPQEISKEIIGVRGTESEILNNHKALLFSKEKNLLAFPITVLDYDASTANNANQMTYGSFSFQGAYVYGIELPAGFKLRGKLTHLSQDDYKLAGDRWGDGSKYIKRVLFIDNNLYTLSDWGIIAYRQGDLQPLASLKY